VVNGFQSPTGFAITAPEQTQLQPPMNGQLHVHGHGPEMLQPPLNQWSALQRQEPDPVTSPPAAARPVSPIRTATSKIIANASALIEIPPP
jgi:hypothetical protein